MYLLYKNNTVIAKMMLIASFDTYEAMCNQVGYPIADEADFGYEDEGGGFHQTENDADRYADTFWKERRVETLGGEKYMFELIEASERELRKFLKDGKPVATQDQFGSMWTEADQRTNEQRFYEEPVKKWIFKASPPNWYMDKLGEPYCQYRIFRPTFDQASMEYKRLSAGMEIGPDWTSHIEEETEEDAQAAFNRGNESTELPW